VRIPVVNGHFEVGLCQVGTGHDLDEVRSLLSDAPGVTLVDDPAVQSYDSGHGSCRQDGGVHRPSAS